MKETLSRTPVEGVVMRSGNHWWLSSEANI